MTQAVSHSSYECVRKNLFIIPWQLLELQDVPKALEVYCAIVYKQKTPLAPFDCSLNDLFDVLRLTSSGNCRAMLKHITQAIDALHKAGLLAEAPDFEHMKYKKRAQKHIYKVADANLFENEYPFHRFILYRQEMDSLLFNTGGGMGVSKKFNLRQRILVLFYLRSRINAYKDRVLLGSYVGLSKKVGMQYSNFHYCVQALKKDGLIYVESYRRKNPVENRIQCVTIFVNPWSDYMAKVAKAKARQDLYICQQITQNPQHSERNLRLTL